MGYLAKVADVKLDVSGRWCCACVTPEKSVFSSQDPSRKIRGIQAIYWIIDTCANVSLRCLRESGGEDGMTYFVLSYEYYTP